MDVSVQKGPLPSRSTILCPISFLLHWTRMPYVHIVWAFSCLIRTMTFLLEYQLKTDECENLRKDDN